MAILYPEALRHNAKKHYNSTGLRPVNMNATERILSAAAGAFLIYSGVNSLLKSPINAICRVIAGSVLLNNGTSGYCQIYDSLDSMHLKPEAINIKHHFTINKPREEVYQFWRNVENLPLFMRHLESVTKIDSTHSKWKAKFASYLPSVTWTAEIVKERENEFIGWSSIEGSTIVNIGKVEFYDNKDGFGTEVRVIFSYHAPVSNIATGIARLFTPAIENILREDINNFKKYIEGETSPKLVI